MKRTRVMMIAPYPPARGRIDGGVAAATVYLSDALCNAGIDLVGVRLTSSPQGRAIDDTFRWPICNLPIGRFGFSTLYGGEIRHLRTLVEKYKPDLVHGQGVDLTGLLAVRSGRPAVVTVHGIASDCARLLPGAAARARALLAARYTEVKALTGARDVVVVSPYATRRYRGTIKGRIHEVPNAISPRYFCIDRRPQKGRVLFAGRITRGKGVLDLVHAAALRRESISNLILAGAAPDRDYLELVRRELRRLRLVDQVQLAGLLDEAQLCEQFSSAEILVLPSYQETAPMVIQQAMAAGLPVIATAVGGIPHLISDNSEGLLFKPGDVAELAGLLGRLLDDPTSTERIGRSGKLAAEQRFRPEAVARATIDIYESVMFGSDPTQA